MRPTSEALSGRGVRLRSGGGDDVFAGAALVGVIELADSSVIAGGGLRDGVALFVVEEKEMARWSRTADRLRRVASAD